MSAVFCHVHPISPAIFLPSYLALFLLRGLLIPVPHFLVLVLLNYNFL